jgi:hypothetical protein
MTAVDIVVDFAWMCLKGFHRWAVVLLVSFLAVFRALSHSPNSSARWYAIIARVYDRHSSLWKRHP